MATLQFNGVGIRGLAAAVPRNTIDNLTFTEYFPADDVRDIVEKTGIKQRRFAEPHQAASDFCFAAADALLNELGIDRQEIDLLVFVSQTPDYRMPATSVILQERLGLGKHTAAFDMNLGCSAFVYGLSVVYSFMQQGSFRKALLLDGETRSRMYSVKDRQTGFLFGDGGVAALIEKDPAFGPSHFSLHSDGSRSDLIKVDAGGYRNPSTVHTVTERVVDEHGNIRSDEQAYMKGAEVFNFVLREIPPVFAAILDAAGLGKEDIDQFVFHQANIYMNSYLGKKLKLDMDKVPLCLDRYGNTSSVSIPLTIVSELQGKLADTRQVMLCGFGVGLSWAAAILQLNRCTLLPVLEVD